MQDQAFRGEAAKLWHWVANICRNPDFTDLAAQAKDTLLHPGFVGSKYPTDGTGTLVIGMNPGGGADTSNTQEKKTLVDIRDEETLEAYDRLNSLAGQLFKSWPIWRNNLLPLLADANVDPATVAYSRQCGLESPPRLLRRRHACGGARIGEVGRATRVEILNRCLRWQRYTSFELVMCDPMTSQASTRILESVKHLFRTQKAVSRQVR